jgi:predicted transcriptional regulator
MKILDLMNEATYPHSNIEDSMSSIRELMQLHDVSYLPLLDNNGEVFGVIDSAVLEESHQSDAPEASLNPWELCNRHFSTAGPDSSIEKIVHELQGAENGSGFVVIVEEGRYIGAVSADYLMSKIMVSGENAQEADMVIKTEAP